MPVVSVRVVCFIWPHSSRNTITYVISVNRLSLTGLGSLANYYPYTVVSDQLCVVALVGAGRQLNYTLFNLVADIYSGFTVILYFIEANHISSETGINLSTV